VGSERRQHDRVTKPFDGRWSGASGANECRISDISTGGCFVQSLTAAPNPGEATTVTVSFGQNFSMSLTGNVVYVEPGQGFAVKFAELPENDAAVFRAFIGQLAK
jgi:hypothetical protein